MLLIITEYFYPFLDGGGPLRSIENLVSCIDPYFETKLISSSKSYKGESLPIGYKTNSFSENSNCALPIAYISKSINGFLFIIGVVQKNDTIYVNGLFMPSLNLIPIIISSKIIISPRGMLQLKLLHQKKWQKLIYLSILKTIFYFKKIKWHATTQQEASEIKNVFGDKSVIRIISNIPVTPCIESKNSVKESRSLSLVYYGLIVENKGLLTLIQTLKSLNLSISLDIYGSIKDQSYWEACLKEINSNNSQATFNYLGHANPSESQQILAKYDAFVLLTKGENFGHSIYESLSVGTPVIISDKTPWVFEESGTPAGWLVNYANNEFDTVRLKQVLEALFNMDSITYSLCTAAAHKYAVDFYNAHDFQAQYSALFNSFN